MNELEKAQLAVEQANQAVLAASETIQKLVAENVALKAVVGECQEYFTAGIRNTIRPSNEGYLHMLCDTARDETLATDAAIAEIKVQGVDELAKFILRDASGDRESVRDVGEIIEIASEFADNLRAGRKG